MKEESRDATTVSEDVGITHVGEAVKRELDSNRDCPSSSVPQTVILGWGQGK